jgi:hypothetical protein
LPELTLWLPRAAFIHKDSALFGRKADIGALPY